VNKNETNTARTL